MARLEHVAPCHHCGRLVPYSGWFGFPPAPGIFCGRCALAVTDWKISMESSW